MPDYNQLLKTKLPEALDDAIEAINFIYEEPEQLLHVDVSEFESLSCCVFVYFTRDDVFYLNRAGRNLLKLRLPYLPPCAAATPPIFWLEHDANLTAADSFVLGRKQPVFNTRELVTLSWGKTWLEGVKFPIQSPSGQPLAILFAGHELAPSEQVRQVAEHYQRSELSFGNN